jgi:metallo-beta-lactamase class B
MKVNLNAARRLLASKEPAPPTKVFDNVGIVGSPGTSALVIETSEGLILLDAILPGKVYSDMLESGMRALGYNPADIKFLLISHGHPDHTGCGRHFIDSYGTVPYMSRVDYAFALDASKNESNPEWQFDYRVSNFIEGGETLILGDTAIQVYSTPGHTPGGLSFLIPVRDQGRPHMAALWGGSAPPPDITLCRTYLESLEAFKAACRQNHADADLHTHPPLNNGMERMAVMRNRIDQVANPFITGTDGCLRYLDMFRGMAEDALKILEPGK